MIGAVTYGTTWTKGAKDKTIRYLFNHGLIKSTGRYWDIEHEKVKGTCNGLMTFGKIFEVEGSMPVVKFAEWLTDYRGPDKKAFRL